LAKKYAIKEIYFTLQGEGFHSGQPAVFCRFAGCNLWSGLEKDRQSAVCSFCDTDFIDTKGPNGGKYTAEQLAALICSQWPDEKVRPVFAVLTGGEPMLQVDQTLIDALHEAGIYIAIETNGTLPVPAEIDWVCVSPKANTEIVQTHGDELKLVYPQVENKPTDFLHLDFSNYYLQPLDNANQEENILATIDYIKAHPRWKLSLQTHKILGLP